jgi:4-hydroxybenzoate polyprenyltransferase
VCPGGGGATAAAALVLLYAAGMATNDVVDAAVDRVERSRRPIPSGRLSRSGAGVFAAVATAIALALLAALDWRAGAAGAGLALCSLAYNLTHRLSAASVVLMGGCRALAVVTAALATGPVPGDARWTLAAAAGGLWAYVVLISVVARAEAGDRRRVRVVVAMLCAISLLDAGWLAALGWWPQAGAALACFALAAWGQRRILGT